MDVPETLRRALEGCYALDRELGQGGMATVYLAEDLKHHRKVALKVLRPEIAATVGAGRFAREIEVAARLQHPNILPLLDSGGTGAQGHGGTDEFLYYVMPYVEGESLRDRLARGGELPVQDAVRILMEVADALSHAHSHGVVHRDIKPDNVMLSGRHALVADFGVAKAVTEATGQQLLTSTGVALGTPTYMAPEQAMADPHQDHRVDIYALGVLGYELLTGRAPFSATTAQEMLAAHVTAQPDPVEKYRASVSPALAAVVMKCLAKKPADRWQTAEEVLQQLEPLATPSGGTTPTQTRPIIALGNVPRWGKWAGGVAAVVIVALVVIQLLKPKPLTITISDVTQVTSDPGVELEPAISPDGKEVAYTAGPINAEHLVIRSTVNAAGGAVRLADTSAGGEWFPAWSPDGEFVRYLGCAGPLFTGCAVRETGRMGGGAREYALPPSARNPAWSSDGRVAFVRSDTIYAVSQPDAAPRVLAVTGNPHSLAWSPDGELLAYAAGNSWWRFSGNVNASGVWVVSTTGGEPRPVSVDEHVNVSPAWLDARHLMFVSKSYGPLGAYVVEVGATGRRGQPRVIPGVVDPHAISYSIASGKLAWARFTHRQNIWAYPLGRAAPVSIRDGRRVTDGSTVIEVHDVSPDGRWIAFDNSLRNNMDLFKLPVTGGEAVPLTDAPSDESNPRWSRDGSEIAFYSTVLRPGGADYHIMVMPARGGGATALTSGHVDMMPTWSPNRLRIAFERYDSGAERLWVLSRDSIGAPWHEPVRLTDFACIRADWSPDGSSLLCKDQRRETLDLVSPQTGRLLRDDLASAAHLTLLPGVAFERFSRDGRTVFAHATDQQGRRGVWAIPLAGGPARLVVSFDDPALDNFAGIMSIGPDTLYLTVAEYESDIWVAKLKY